MKNLALYILAFISLSASAFEEFLITDIRIIGLQRVSIGSIFTAIPVSVGDRMTQAKVSDISKALFATAQFKDGHTISVQLTDRLRDRQQPEFLIPDHPLEFTGKKMCDSYFQLFERLMDNRKEIIEERDISNKRLLNQYKLGNKYFYI